MRIPRRVAVSTPDTRSADAGARRNALRHAGRPFRAGANPVYTRVMSAEATATPSTPSTRSPLRALDDLVFRAENGLLSFALIATTVMVFLDVVYRRLVAPDSKVGAILAAIAGITEPTARAALDANVAPWAGVLLTYLVMLVGTIEAQRRKGARALPFKGSAFVVALGLTIGVVGFAWLMLSTSSRNVYLVLFGVALAVFIASTARAKERGWAERLGAAALVFAPLFVYIAFTFFPDDYTWAKELSMLLILWVGFFGASVCVPIGKHIRVESLDKAIPARFRAYVRAAGYVVTAAFCLLFTYLGYRYVFLPDTGLYAIGGRLAQTGVPDWVQTVAVPIAFGLTMVRFIAAAVSALRGGDYGTPAKAEGMEDAEKAAESAEKTPEMLAAQRAAEEAERRGKPVVLAVVGVVAIGLCFLGKGGLLGAAILVMVALGLPMFVLLGIVAVLCFFLWGGLSSVNDLTLIERVRGLADNQALLAIPFFIMSGAVMGRGEISKRLVAFSMALVGWLPGGLAVSAVLACMIFAAISGSSPATVVAIGGMMAPSLIAQGYKKEFSYGLVTSAGSLGILIPPSIPMIVYAIVNTTAPIQVERLFACGYGPGIVIGSILMAMGIAQGIRDKTPRQTFSLPTLWRETRDGIWALLFPVIISVGIFSGIFNAIESACFSVVYAVVVEVFIHRAVKLSEIPGVFQETGVMLGSFLVILVVAMTFGEFLDMQGLPALAASWVDSMHLEPWQFLVVVNLLLLVVGCLLDIMSAIFIFVPLLAPMALAAGIDPLHFGIIFIVNLEIGYLTPPVGLNLFIASTLFNKPVGYITRAVLPFVAVMLVGLAIITFTDAPSVGVANWLIPPTDSASARPAEAVDDAPAGDTPTPQPGANGGAMTMEEMMRQAEQGAAAGDAPAAPQRVLTMEEMMRLADEEAAEPDAGVGAAPGAAPAEAPAGGP